MKPIRAKTHAILCYAHAIEQARAERFAMADICRALALAGVVGVTEDGLRYCRQRYFANQELISSHMQLSLPSLFEAPQLQPPASTIDTTERDTQDTHNAQLLQIPTPRQEVPVEPTPTSSPTADTAPQEPTPKPASRTKSTNALRAASSFDKAHPVGKPVTIAPGVTAQWGTWTSFQVNGPPYNCEIIGPDYKVRFAHRDETGTWIWFLQDKELGISEKHVRPLLEGGIAENKPDEMIAFGDVRLSIAQAQAILTHLEWYKIQNAERNKL